MIKIRCFNKYNINNCTFNAFINNKCFKSKEGVIIINPPNGIYKITIYNQTKIIYYNKSDINIDFIFYNAVNQRVVHLTDHFYKGLKIGKGLIILNGI